MGAVSVALYAHIIIIPGYRYVNGVSLSLLKQILVFTCRKQRR